MAKQHVFDASALDTVAACNKPAEIEIKHPVTGVATGLFVSVLGRDSDVYRGRIRAMIDEQMRGNSAPKGVDDAEKETIDTLVAATVSWRSTGDDKRITLHGEPLDCTPDNARKLYAAILPIRDQVSAGINKLGNFMAAS